MLRSEPFTKQARMNPEGHGTHIPPHSAGPPVFPVMYPNAPMPVQPPLAQAPLLSRAKVAELIQMAAPGERLEPIVEHVCQSFSLF